MNKKVLLIPVAIGLIIFTVAQIIKKDETGNRFEMVIPEVDKDAASDKELKGLTMYLDNSGSMKGYLDFANMPNGNQANATFIGTLSNFMDKVKSAYKIEPVCQCGGSTYARGGFLQGMENFSIFKGAVTELHKAISDLASVATDSTVAVLVSDMVLSYGRKTLESKGQFYNKQQLEQLGAYVHDAMTDAKDRNLHALVLQYYGDFNGRYYYNYTENIVPNCYKDTLMRNRPYYFLVIGKETLLKGLMAKQAFTKPVHIYATFDMPAPNKKQAFELKQRNNDVAWIIGNPDPKYAEASGTLMTNADFGDAVSSVEVSYPRFDVPGYINTQKDGKLKLVWDETIIKNVSIESNAEAATQILAITFKPHKELHTTPNIKILLCNDNDWVDAATTDDDTDGLDISGKTWGFSTIVNNINKVFRSTEKLTPETIAELKFDIIIK